LASREEAIRAPTEAVVATDTASSFVVLLDPEGTASRMRVFDGT
jgi:hypothetical protein